MQLESTEPEAKKHKLLNTNIEEMAEESSPAKKAKFEGVVDNMEGSQQPLNGMIKVEEKEKKCWNCDEIGHLQKECKEPQKEVEGADCDVCKIFVKKIHVQYHYEGVRHAKNVKRATGPPPEKKDCSICNITLIGEAQYNAHLEGKKHKKKMESPNKSENQSKFQCELCNVEIMGEEQYNKHLEGKKHKKKLETPNKSENQTKFLCELCNVEILGEDQYNKHLEGKKHKKKVENPNQSFENNVQSKFQCEFCNVTICGEAQYNSHLVGKKHQKKVIGNSLGSIRNHVPMMQGQYGQQQPGTQFVPSQIPGF